MLIIVLLLGLAVFGLRGPYFAIGTLGVAVAAREIAEQLTLSEPEPVSRCRFYHAN